MAEQKTNVMRILEQKKIPYTPHSYPHGDEAVDGVTVAALTGLNPEQVYKTLVTRGASKQLYVFVIPVTGELDLKKAAKAVGEKSIVMIHVSEITPMTGYVRGGRVHRVEDASYRVYTSVWLRTGFFRVGLKRLCTAGKALVRKEWPAVLDEMPSAEVWKQ